MPLKEAIERLGKIVFGAGFEVEIDDNWSLISRTLHEKTLPFDDLSVGVKEQLGILTRLVAAQIVSKQRSPKCTSEIRCRCMAIPITEIDET